MKNLFENFLLVVCSLLNTILNPGILILAIFEATYAVQCLLSLNARKKEIINLAGESRKKRQTAQKSGKGKVTTTYEATIERDWAKYDGFRQKYQDSLSVYNKFTLIIHLFPLLGILGTVAGLYIAMNAPDGAESLYTGVGFALSSTIWGIICAIVFKLFDVFLSNMVNVIDDNIDRYEKNYTVESQEAQDNIPNIVTNPAATVSTSARREQ